MTEVTIRFPFAWRENDYHNFSSMQFILQKLTKEHIEFQEVAFDGDYWAVFYIGEEPIDFINQTRKQVEGY